jgi:hypothetical protein
MENKIPYSEASSWQNKISADTAHWQDLKRIASIIVPIGLLTGIMVMAGYAYDLLHRDEWGTVGVTQFLDKLLKTRFHTAYLLPAIFLLVIIYLIFYATRNFVLNFYNPTEEIRIARRIRQRLFGAPPLPFPLSIFWKYTSVTIKEPKDLELFKWAVWWGGPAPLNIYDGNALYLEQGNHFSRVVGPGKPPKPFLDRYETIKAVVDLRPQIKTGTIHPWTKDGIQLNITLTMESQINTSDEARLESRSLVYPYDPIAVKQAVEYTSVKFKEDEKEKHPNEETAGQLEPQSDNPPSNIQAKKELVESGWLEGIWDQTTGYLGWHISCHTIDEIALSKLLSDTGPSEGNLYTFKLAQEHIDAINARCRDFECGAHVSNIQITMGFPQEVEDYRIKYWESIRQSHSSARKSKAEGDRIRLVEDARARAERDMLDAITDRLKDIDKENLTEPLLMSLTGILDSSLDDPLFRPIIAKSSLSLLDHLRKTLTDRF